MGESRRGKRRCASLSPQGASGGCTQGDAGASCTPPLLRAPESRPRCPSLSWAPTSRRQCSIPPCLFNCAVRPQLKCWKEARTNSKAVYLLHPLHNLGRKLVLMRRCADAFEAGDPEFAIASVRVDIHSRHGRGVLRPTGKVLALDSTSTFEPPHYSYAEYAWYSTSRDKPGA